MDDQNMKEVLSGNAAQDTWVLLRRASLVILRARSRELSQFGLTSAMAGLIQLVLTLGRDATPAELSRQLFREPHTVSDLLNRMEKAGLIRKIKDLDRKNMIRIELTDKGRECYDKSTTQTKSIQNIMSALSEEELRVMMSYLKRIRDKAIEELALGSLNKRLL